MLYFDKGSQIISDFKPEKDRKTQLVHQGNFVLTWKDGVWEVYEKVGEDVDCQPVLTNFKYLDGKPCPSFEAVALIPLEGAKKLEGVNSVEPLKDIAKRKRFKGEISVPLRNLPDAVVFYLVFDRAIITWDKNSWTMYAFWGKIGDRTVYTEYPILDIDEEPKDFQDYAPTYGEERYGDPVGMLKEQQGIEGRGKGPESYIPCDCVNLQKQRKEDSD